MTIGHSKEVDGIRYWNDELSTVAISLDNITYDAIGSYTCSYGQLSKAISVNGMLWESVSKGSNVVVNETHKVETYMIILHFR